MSDLSNMSLEDLLEELSKYGRPTVNQFSGSATPGVLAAGTWGVEVVINVCSFEEAGRPDWYFTPCTGAPKGWGSTGRRCMGRGPTPTVAARIALAEAIEVMESPAGPYFRPLSTEAVRAAELARKG